MSPFLWGEPAAPAAAREESIPLPRPEKSRSETALMSVLCLAAGLAVFQFFASMVTFAERVPRLAEQIHGFRPEFVRHLLALEPTTNTTPALPVTAPATAIAMPVGSGRSPS